MDNDTLASRFEKLTTAHLADGCVRAGVAVRCAPTGLVALAAGMRLAGRVIPVRHVGSVDIFLEAFESCAPGDVLVVDNGGRLDESCVGDLVALEAASAALGGIAVWGLHRDTVDILAIGLPLFSLGALPTGPLSVGDRAPDALDAATVGEWTVGRRDLVFGDEDGVLFVPAEEAERVFSLAESIRDTERMQAERIRSGVSLRSQVRLGDFLASRALDPGLSFRDHLRTVGGEIEV
ncbi:RraA family protein [Lacisediminihabitans profunda]|uniref:Putative 4-hydroxy-4-methyl-2-oxoglutarate aldolase n=1 Tax=Lacisediminihabitans profunda TaxID=2594790 RepID=A0A5C8UQZ7_9MICO|nr:RraA family protein [Lacisediminihabitans profunda]TXN29889.1 RraA family protein [Lacisediminihabitans profunda]